ncbi:MAG: hypothetical protein M0Q40_01835 [Limnochordia bacterium]|nr:hypothetical protein [Limnochordia bacterium]
MEKTLRISVWVVLLVGLLSIGVYAQESKQVTIEVIDAPIDDTSVTGDLKEDIWVIAPKAGYVRITFERMEITATRVEYFGKEQRALITGQVRVVKEDSVITADKVEALFDEERYIISGNVHLVQRESAGEGTKVELRSGYLEYFDTENKMIAQEDVVFFNKDREGRADVVTYLDAEEVVFLTGNASLITEQGTWRGASFTIDLDNESIIGTGPGRLDFTL